METRLQLRSSHYIKKHFNPRTTYYNVCPQINRIAKCASLRVVRNLNKIIPPAHLRGLLYAITEEYERFKKGRMAISMSRFKIILEYGGRPFLDWSIMRLMASADTQAELANIYARKIKKFHYLLMLPKEKIVEFKKKLRQSNYRLSAEMCTAVVWGNLTTKNINDIKEVINEFYVSGDKTKQLVLRVANSWRITAMESMYRYSGVRFCAKNGKYRSGNQNNIFRMMKWPFYVPDDVAEYMTKTINIRRIQFDHSFNMANVVAYIFELARLKLRDRLQQFDAYIQGKVFKAEDENGQDIKVQDTLYGTIRDELSVRRSPNIIVKTLCQESKKLLLDLVGKK